MSDSTATLSLVIKAKDLASGQVGTLNKSLKSLKTGGLDGLGIGMLGAAGAAAFLTGALVKGVKGAIDEEAGIARLGQALKANVADWDGNTAAIEDTIKSRTDMGFADDELRASLAKLVPATHDVSKAFDVQRTAMDLARLKGIDLETASQALVKVEAGQYRALKDLGIVLKDGATQTDALAAVQAVAQGQAAAYMDTTAGKTELMTKRFDELTEKVGGALLPTLDATVGVLNTLSGALNDVDVSTADWVSTLVTGSVPTITGALADQVGRTADAFHRLVDPQGAAAESLRDFRQAERDSLEPTHQATTANNNLARSLGRVAQSGADAAAAVKDEIDALTEGRYISNSKKPITKGKGSAAGGWVGQYGPETITVGERGPEYVTPNHQLGGPARGGTGGVMLQGVSERELMDMVDRQMYFRLRRAPS
jgi:hypothetical protein